MNYSTNKINKYFNNDFIDEIIILDTIDSTNNYASKLESFNNTLIISLEQTKGRGLQNKEFYSPKNTGIYMSILFFEKKYFDLLTIKTAVAICLALENLYNYSPTIKWVNDIYINNFKISGILTESVNNKYILGIGINISTLFSVDLNKKASSLQNIKNIKIDENLLIATIINNLFLNIDYIQEYSKRLMKTLKITYAKKEASIIGINNQGYLIISLNNEIKEVSTGVTYEN